jgi:predicted Zn-dependent protease
MDLRIAIVPVGRMDPSDVEAAAVRIAKILNRAVTLRQPAPVPKAGDDPARGQHLAGPFLAELRGQLARLPVAKSVGPAPVLDPAGSSAAATIPAEATLFVTDVDLFRPQTDGVFGDIDAAAHVAVVSVRRLREAFYKRKADPAKARGRLVKLALYALGRARGLPDCRERACALFTTTALTDIDRKPEKYCALCWRRMTTGAYRI